MRISWLPADTIVVTRAALRAHGPWHAHFSPHFTAPPAPEGIEADDWPRIAEHVARIERVSELIRTRGLHDALAAFGESQHAVELATLTAAASQIDAVTFDLVAALLQSELDELLVYGPFLDLLQKLSTDQRDRAMVIYERVCDEFSSRQSRQPMWSERVAAVRDGLAGFYVQCGHHEQAEAIFADRVAETPRTLVVALSASRAFLAAGVLARTIAWLERGAERAIQLGRPEMANRLRQKQINLRSRQS